MPPTLGFHKKAGGTTASTNQSPSSSPSKSNPKPSLLRNQLLRRTTKRAKKLLAAKEPLVVTVDNEVTVEVAAVLPESEAEDSSKSGNSSNSNGSGIDTDIETDIDIDIDIGNDDDDDDDESRGPSSSGSDEEERKDAGSPNTNTMSAKGDAASDSSEEEEEIDSNSNSNPSMDEIEMEMEMEMKMEIEMKIETSVRSEENEDENENENETDQSNQGIVASATEQHPACPDPVVEVLDAEDEEGEPAMIDEEEFETSFAISDIDSNEDKDEECKTEPQIEDPVQSAMLKPPATVAIGSTVSTTNLSILVTGNDIVVEYRDDKDSEQKESSANEGHEQHQQQSARGNSAGTPTSPPSIMATLLSPFGRSSFAPAAGATPTKASDASIRNQQPPRVRPKGIMKRPRDSNLYHHPRRPLPPPLPPPGFPTSNKPSLELTWPEPPKKRVSFDEDLLTKQSRMFQLRRQARNEHRKSISGMLSMAMPIILPYIIAILILVASSMVPLPPPPQARVATAATTASTPTTARSSPISNESRLPPSREVDAKPPIFDIASRLWDERRNSEHEHEHEHEHDLGAMGASAHSMEGRKPSRSYNHNHNHKYKYKYNFNDEDEDDLEAYDSNEEDAFPAYDDWESDQVYAVGTDGLGSASNSNNNNKLAMVAKGRKHGRGKNPVARVLKGLGRVVFRRRRTTHSTDRLSIASS